MSTVRISVGIWSSQHLSESPVRLCFWLSTASLSPVSVSLKFSSDCSKIVGSRERSSPSRNCTSLGTVLHVISFRCLLQCPVERDNLREASVAHSFREASPHGEENISMDGPVYLQQASVLKTTFV